MPPMACRFSAALRSLAATGLGPPSCALKLTLAGTVSSVALRAGLIVPGGLKPSSANVPRSALDALAQDECVKKMSEMRSPEKLSDSWGTDPSMTLKTPVRLKPDLSPTYLNSPPEKDPSRRMTDFPTLFESE